MITRCIRPARPAESLTRWVYGIMHALKTERAFYDQWGCLVDATAGWPTVVVCENGHVTSHGHDVLPRWDALQRAYVRASWLTPEPEKGTEP